MRELVIRKPDETLRVLGELQRLQRELALEERREVFSLFLQLLSLNIDALGVRRALSYQKRRERLLEAYRLAAGSVLPLLPNNQGMDFLEAFLKGMPLEELVRRIL